MAAYRVDLEIFAGPLDLLLYLVRKEEVDIYDIPLAKITDQYIRYIEMLKSLDIDLAGDFLVMASTLMEIKSAMLLPKVGPEELDAEELIDPRAELIRQLLEYKKFKDAANLLNAAADEHKQRFGRPDTVTERLKPKAEPEVDIESVSIWDLLEAFDAIMKATGPVIDMSHIKDDTPIDLYQIEILHRLQSEGPMGLEKLFESRRQRLAMVGMFLAILELVRDALVSAHQDKSSGAIYLQSLTDEPAEQAVQKAILEAAGDFEETPAEEDNETEQVAEPAAEEEVADSEQPAAEPPIEIVEVPAQPEPASVEIPDETDTPIPIAEIPPKKTASPQTEDAETSQSSGSGQES